jgi:hypothetical protein
MSEAQSTQVIDDAATCWLGAWEIDPSTCRVRNGRDIVKPPLQAIYTSTSERMRKREHYFSRLYNAIQISHSLIL